MSVIGSSVRKKKKKKKGRKNPKCDSQCGSRNPTNSFLGKGRMKITEDEKYLFST